MYLIFDLDDTLLTSDKKITHYSKQVLEKCQNKGHLIVINSARGFCFMENYIKDIHADYTIANGGSEIYKSTDLIHFNGINVEDTNKIIKELLDNNIERFSIQTTQKLYASSLDYTKANQYAHYFDFTTYFPYEASKIVILSNEPSFMEKLSTKYSLTLTNYLNGNWYRLSKTTKELGNKTLFKILNDNNPKAIVFGDDIGDLEMLKAHHGVALKNSVQSVLDEIETITEFTNNEDGAAKYLNMLLEKGIL